MASTEGTDSAGMALARHWYYGPLRFDAESRSPGDDLRVRHDGLTSVCRTASLRLPKTSTPNLN